jgi:hypothetical protein
MTGNTKRARWTVINNLLQNGMATYVSMEEACRQNLDINEDLYDILRTDIKEINKLLQANNLPKIISPKRGVYSYASPNIDIIPYIKDRAPSVYFRQLCDLLSHSKGLLNDEWLENMHIHLKEENADTLYDRRIIEFEHNENFDADQYLPVFFKAIYERNVLSIKYNPYNGKEYIIELHPHYLKQYRKIWYVYGYMDSSKSEQCIALDRVKSEPVIIKGACFHKSEINFNAYFEDVIGATKYTGQKVSRIMLQIKSKDYTMIMNKPIHSSQCHYKALDDNEWKGLILDVQINPELKRILYSYGDIIKVVGPSSLVKDMKRFAKRVNSFYL